MKYINSLDTINNKFIATGIFFLLNSIGICGSDRDYSLIIAGIFQCCCLSTYTHFSSVYTLDNRTFILTWNSNCIPIVTNISIMVRFITSGVFVWLRVIGIESHDLTNKN